MSFFDDSIYLYFLPVLVLAVLLFFPKGKGKQAGALSYRTVDLLSPAERSFYSVLQQAVRGELVVFSKVRVADVITPNKTADKKSWARAFNMIAKKHFDFVLCDPSTLTVRCVIELNDRSHRQRKRAERDKGLQQACDSAGLVLLFIPAQRGYSLVEIRQQVAGFFRSSDQQVSAVSGQDFTAGFGEHKTSG